MSRKALSQTNPYLRNPELRRKMIRDHVVSSTAIEGVHLKFSEKPARLKKKDSGTSDKV